MADEVKYYPALALVNDLSSTDDRDTKLRIGYFGNKVEFKIYNQNRGGMRSPIANLTMSDIEGRTVMEAIATALVRFGENPGTDGSFTFGVKSWDNESKKRVAIGSIEVMYQASNGRIAFRITAKGDINMTFVMYDLSGVDIDPRLFGDRGRGGVSAFMAASQFNFATAKIDAIPVTKAIFETEHPRPERQGGGRQGGGGYSGSSYGGTNSATTGQRPPRVVDTAADIDDELVY